MNPYLKNVNKIEFVVTDACTGRCRHCSQGEHVGCAKRIDPAVAADAVRKIAAEYDVQTVMTFGGEPLLHAEAVYAIMKAAKELHIPRRQVITNGCFTKSIAKMHEVAARLAESGVNDLLLSVDAFHQECLPLGTVLAFAREVLAVHIPVRISPAWLVSRVDDNPYNCKTCELLEAFADLGIPIGEGNVIFPEGNARKYLSDYFTGELPVNPYEESPDDVRCISFSANGDVLGGNVYQRDVLEIMASYSLNQTL